MEKIKDRLQITFVLIAIVTACYNIYTGATLQKLGIPGVFEVEFNQPGTEDDSAGKQPPSTSPDDVPAAVERINPPRIAPRFDAYAALEAQAPSFEDLASEFYDVNSQAGETYIYDVAMNHSQDVLWVYGWCTTTKGLLTQNWDNISLVFMLDGEEVPLDRFAPLEGRLDEMECRFYYALLTDWPHGEHLLTTEVTFTAAINDGLDYYPAGTHIYAYRVYVAG